METLADYGTVSYFGVQTFTTGIYRAWFSLGDRVAAAQLALCLLGFVVLVLALERAVARARALPRHRPAPPGAARRAGCAAGARRWRSPAACCRCCSASLLPAACCCSWRSTEGDAQFGARFVAAGRATACSLAALTAAARGRRSRCWSPTRARLDPRPGRRASRTAAAGHGLRGARRGDRGRRADPGDAARPRAGAVAARALRLATPGCC